MDNKVNGQDLRNWLEPKSKGKENERLRKDTKDNGKRKGKGKAAPEKKQETNAKAKVQQKEEVRKQKKRKTDSDESDFVMQEADVPSDDDLEDESSKSDKEDEEDDAKSDDSLQSDDVDDVGMSSGVSSKAATDILYWSTNQSRRTQAGETRSRDLRRLQSTCEPHPWCSAECISEGAIEAE